MQGNLVSQYDVQSGTVTNTLRGHHSVVNCVTLHGAMPFAFTGAADTAVLVWSAPPPHPLTQRQPPAQQPPHRSAVAASAAAGVSSATAAAALAEDEADVDNWSDND